MLVKVVFQLIIYGLSKKKLIIYGV